MQVMLCQWWEEDLSIEFLWGAIKRCRIKDDTNVPDRLSGWIALLPTESGGGYFWGLNLE